MVLIEQIYLYLPDYLYILHEDILSQRYVVHITSVYKTVFNKKKNTVSLHVGTGYVMFQHLYFFDYKTEGMLMKAMIC
jgi:hypothetical protein